MTYALLFGALPFAATGGAALLAGRRGSALLLAFSSAGIGLLSLLFVALRFASDFAN